MSLSHLVNSLWRSGKRTLTALALAASYAMPALPSMSCGGDFTSTLNCAEGDSLVTESGVRIVWEVEPDMFSEEMTSAPVNAYAIPLCRQKSVDRLVAAVLRGLAKYPDSLLVQNLKTVYLVDRLEIYDTPAGGMADQPAQRIYIANSNSACRIERLFHAEFSSILIFRHPWDISRWEAVNPEGFTYSNDVTAAIRDDRVSGELDHQWAEDGFLTSYSMTTVVNDFNAYAQYHFLPESLLWEIVDTYPRVQRKSSLMIDFYNTLHPQYTNAFFRNLDLCEE